MSKKYAVVSDFDGTITTFDMAHRIVEHYSGVASDPYALPGEDGKSWMSRQMKAVKTSQKEFEKFILSQAKARKCLLELVQTCFDRGVPFEIASGGVDLYIRPFLLKNKIAGVPLYCARGAFGQDGIELNFEDFAGQTLGEFKAMRVRHYKELGYTVIFCGDGHTDVKAAREADHVFAAGSLINTVNELGISAVELKTFEPVIELIRS